MPPVSKKHASIILYDLNTRNKDACKQTLMQIVCKQFFTETKDLTKLVLFNSSVTRNRVEAQYGGYENIYETSESVMNYNPQIILDMVENIEPSETCNWLEALLVATKCLREDYDDVGGIVTYQLLVISDFSVAPPDHDNNTIQDIVDGLSSVDAFLYFVGPEIKVPFPIKSPESVKSWMQNLNVDVKDKNLTLIKEIITATSHSLVCNFKMGVHLFFSYKNFGGSQAWKVPLAIGTEVAIPADTMKLLNEGMECKLVSSQQKTIVTWISAEDESVEVETENVIHGVSRHGKFVQMPDNKMFQAENPRGFNIVCFTKSTNVPEYIMTGDGCYCVYPAENPTSVQAMAVLVDCLAQQGKYAIARRVYNANNVPRIVALIPKPEHQPKCFYLASLPFADDVRYDYREKSAKLAPEIENKSQEVFDYLDSLDIDRGHYVNNYPLGVAMMQDVNCAKVVNKAADKLFDKYLQLNEVEIDYLVPKVLSNEGEKLKSVWPERELKEVKKEEAVSGDESNDEYDW